MFRRTAFSRRIILGAFALGFIIGAAAYSLYAANRSAEERYVVMLTERCADAPTKYACLEPVVTETIQREGLAAGLRMMKAWYGHSTEFRPYCDAMTRYLGRAAQKKIPDYTVLAYTEESVWCNYGFFHGYMQAYMEETPDPEKGAEFCTHIGAQLKDSAPGAQSECFRALGYAFVLINDKKRKDIEYVADESVRMCKEYSIEPLDLHLCQEGVFSQLGQSIAAGGYGDVSEKNPLWLCDRQPADMQNICYATMKWLPLILFDIRGDDIEPGFKKIQERYSETEIQRLEKTIEQLIFTLAYNQARRGTALPAEESYRRGIDACTSLPFMFLRQCISGFGFGLAKGGIPGEQYKDVLAFCATTSDIPGYAVKDCAPSALLYFERYYPKDLFARICEEYSAALGTACTAQ